MSKLVVITVVLRVSKEEVVTDVRAVETRRGYYDEIEDYSMVEVSEEIPE